ncbi:MAG: MG2 domain-containing protein [Kiritimatiellaeota bacterium]|nr:MG2 domain-containing protein [Kiritimatiellota bacterium]
MLAAAFLVVNAVGLWRIASVVERRQHEQTEEPTARPVQDVGTSTPVAVEPLRLRGVEASTVEYSQRVRARLQFNAAPDLGQLPRFLSFTTREQEGVDYQIVSPADSQGLVVIETTAPVPDAVLNYTLQEGLPAAGSNRVMTEKVSGTIDLNRNLVFHDMEAECPTFGKPQIRIRLSSTPKAEDAKPFIEVVPPVNMNISTYSTWRGQGIELSGDFKPDGLYAITLQAGLPAADGVTLPKTVKRTLQIPMRHPAIRIDTTGRYLAPHGTLQVPIKAAGMKTFRASLEPVAENNLFPSIMLETQRLEGDFLTGIGETLTNLPLRVETDGTGAGVVALSKLSATPPRGIYRLRVKDEQKDDSGPEDARMIVVTDIGIAAKLSTTSAVVWVNSLVSARAMADARVTLLSDRNETLASGATDPQGLVRLQWAPERFAGKPLAVIAATPDDISYIDVARQSVSLAGAVSAPPYLQEGQLDAAVFTERGIYRPGETLFVQTLVRDSQLHAPAPFLAMLHVIRPNGKTFSEQAVQLDTFGAAIAEIPLPDYASTGTYAIEVRMPGTQTVLGKTTVAVEEFVPPQIRAQIEMPTSPLPAGETLEATVTAAFLFGREAADLPVTASVTYRETPFAPAKWKDWVFGDPVKQFPTVVREAGIGRLDDKGTWAFSTETIQAIKPSAAILAMVSATVREPNGRAVTAYASRRMDAYPFYVGLRPSWQGAVPLAKTQHIDIAALQPDETAVPAPVPLTITLSRVTWISAMRRNPNGRYEWLSERQLTEIRNDTLTVAGNTGTPWWPFAVETAGHYLLAVTDPVSGASSSITFYAGTGDGYWGEWNREKPGTVELEWDRKEAYHPGETARLIIRSPFPGEALLTIGQEAVQTTHRFTLDHNTLERDIAVEEAFAPNAYVTVMVIRPAVAESMWSAHRAVGTVVLPVERPTHRLNVTITAPERIEPQSPLHVRIQAQDAAGQPARGAVTLMAVDEGICLLTAFRTPDPLAYWQRQRELGFRLYDLYSDLMPLMDDTLETTPAPGGDSEVSALRRRLNPIQARRFKSVALWKSNVPLDEHGEAAMVLDVPEFTGALRLMAVAYNAEHVGCETGHVEVKRDLVVQPSLPRFLATDDRCTSVIPLHNTSMNDMDAVVRLIADGPIRVEPAEQRMQVRAGQSTKLEAQWIAGNTPGKALCTIAVEGERPGEPNILYRETIELAVRPAGGLQVTTTPSVLAPNESLTFSAPASWMPESCVASVTMSAFAAVQLGRALDYVVHYPYGCLEQTVSGAFPLLRAQRWIERLRPAAKVSGDPDQYVEAAIRRVSSMQVWDGSFALWPHTYQTDRAASRYAIHFLLEAKQAGFTVPAAVLDPAVKWLGTMWASTSDTTQWRGRTMQDNAYTCHILALAQKPDYGWMSRLTDQADQLNTAACTHLATAWMLAGDPRKATAMLETIPLPTPRPRDAADWGDSDVRDTALLLMAWLEIDAQTPMVGQLVQTLRSRQHDGHFGCTQDNAFALLAFGKLADQLPDAEKPFSGTIQWGGQTQAFGPTNDVASVFGPGKNATTLQLRNDGPGQAFLLVRFEGVDNAPEPPKQQGLVVEQDYLDLAGNPIDTRTLRQGDLVVVRITVDTLGKMRSHLIIESLLPAGWEIENPNVKTSMAVEWLEEVVERAITREARDDRMLFFTDGFSGRCSFHYAIRAVTPGDFIAPPVTVSGMYDPDLRAVSPSRRVTVNP